MQAELSSLTIQFNLGRETLNRKVDLLVVQTEKIITFQKALVKCFEPYDPNYQHLTAKLNKIGEGLKDNMSSSSDS